MQGLRTKQTAWAVIQGIAIQMIRNGQVLGINAAPTARRSQHAETRGEPQSMSAIPVLLYVFRGEFQELEVTPHPCEAP